EGPESEATPAPTHLRRRSHCYRPDDHLQGRVLRRGSFYEQPWSHRSSSGPKMRTVFTGVQSFSLRGAGDHVATAAARATERGAVVLNGPIEVPGGAWIVQARDPQGAAFSMIGACE